VTVPDELLSERYGAPFAWGVPEIAKPVRDPEAVARRDELAAELARFDNYLPNTKNRPEEG
jgi:hypothetical protein